MCYICKKWTGTTLSSVSSPFGSLIFRWLSSTVSRSEGVQSTREQWQEERGRNQRKVPPASAGGRKSQPKRGGTPTPLAAPFAVGLPQPKWPVPAKGPVKESCPE